MRKGRGLLNNLARVCIFNEVWQRALQFYYSERAMCAPAKKRCIPPIHPPQPACRRQGTFDVITRRGMNWGVEGGIICSKVTPGRGECVPRALLKINAIMLIPLLSNILGGKFKVFLISAPAAELIALCAPN